MKTVVNSQEDDEMIVRAVMLLSGDLQDMASEKDQALIKEAVHLIGSDAMVEKCQDSDVDLIRELETTELYQFLELKTNYLEAIHRLACEFMDNNEGDKAQSLFALLTLLDTRQPHFWHGMGLSFVLMDRVSDAIAYYQKARALDEGDAGAYLSEIYAYLTLEQLQLARDVLKLALNVLENYPEQDEGCKEELLSLKRTLKV